MLKKHKGFTLIELMIVIAIIAILAAILVPNFVRARDQGNLAACKSNLKNMGTAFEMYASDNGGIYPSSLTLAAFTNTYMKTTPTCPIGSTAYGLNIATPYQTYSVYCTGTLHSRMGTAYETSNTPYYSSEEGMKP